MGEASAEIDWYGDGFEVRLEAKPMASWLSRSVMALGVTASLVGVALRFVVLDPHAITAVTATWVGGLLVAGAGLTMSYLAGERGTVRVLEVTPRLLRVRGGSETLVELDLSDVASIDVADGKLSIRDGHGATFHVDATGSATQALERVEQALRAAVVARQIPETAAEQRQRRAAVGALEAMRERG